MPIFRKGALALALSLASTPALAASFVTDPITDLSTRWAGIDYWGVQVGQFTTLDQLLAFDLPYDSRIDVYIQGSPKFRFADLLLNGQSIATDFTVDGNTVLKATGYAAAGNASLRFLGDYTCRDCWGDWFGGYVQISKASLPVVTTPPVTSPVPEPGTWAMMIAGIGLVGAALRRAKAKARPAAA